MKTFFFTLKRPLVHNSEFRYFSQLTVSATSRIKATTSLGPNFVAFWVVAFINCMLVYTMSVKYRRQEGCRKTKDQLEIAFMRVYVRLANFTTKPRFQSASWQILSRTKSQSSKNKKNSRMHAACTCQRMRII